MGDLRDKEEGKEGERSENSIEIDGKVYTAEQLKSGITTLNAAKARAETNLITANEELTALRSKAMSVTPPDNNSNKEDVDLESLDRSQYMEHLLSKVRNELVAPIGARVIQGEKALATNTTRQDIKAVEKKYEDFWEFEDEVKSVLKQNSSINIEDAYLLARGKAPEKAKMVETAAQVRNREKNKYKFGGLLPTSGLTRKNSKMGMKDAADAAWEELSVSEHLRSITNN